MKQYGKSLKETTLILWFGVAELFAAGQIIQNDLFWKDLSGRSVRFIASGKGHVRLRNSGIP